MSSGEDNNQKPQDPISTETVENANMTVNGEEPTEQPESEATTDTDDAQETSDEEQRPTLSVSWKIESIEGREPVVFSITEQIEKLSPVPATVFYSTPSLMFDGLGSLSTQEVAGSKEQHNQWLAAINDGAEKTHFPYDDKYGNVTQRPDAIWTQRIDYEGLPISMLGRPKATSSSGNKLTGTRAVQKIVSLTGTGDTWILKLPHSGFSITIRTPTLRKRIGIDQKALDELVRIGRQTSAYGLTLDNYYLINVLIDAVVSDTIDSTLENWTPDLLYNTISWNDVQIIATAYAGLIHSKGFPIELPCSYDISKCQHVEKATLSLPKIIWIDKSRLSVKQRKTLAESKLTTATMVDEYKEEFLNTESNVVTISSGLDQPIKFVLRIPSVAEGIAAGNRWATDIEEMADSSFSRDTKSRERDEYIQRQLSASTLRRYSHWIKHIVADEGDTLVDDKDSINNVLDSLSGNTDMMEEVVDKVSQFMTNSVVGLPAIPNYACPSCGKHQNTLNPKDLLIPLDMVKLGFHLQQLHLMKVGVR